MFIFGGLVSLIYGMVYSNTNWVLLGLGMLISFMIGEILIELRKIRQVLEKHNSPNE